MDSQVEHQCNFSFELGNQLFLIQPEAGLLLVDWSLGVVLPQASASLVATQVQRGDRRVLARKAFEEVEVPVEGLMLSFGEQLLGEPQMGLHLQCRFCCQSSPCLVSDPG